MMESGVSFEGMGVDQMAQKGNEIESGVAAQNHLFELIIKKAKNNTEYRKYAEVTGALVLSYYKRTGSISKAVDAVYMVLSESEDVSELIKHYNALKQEDKSSSDASTDNARAKIANMLLNDYKRRFGESKKEAYNVLVLQSWINKVENINELTIIMDNILSIRDKLGNSWDYEVHIIPLLLEKAFTAESLMDFSNSTTNLIIGLGKRLRDNYLAVMTAVKVLEYADTPTTVKMYIRDMIKDSNKKIDQLSTEIAVMNSNKISKVKNIARIRAMNQQIIELHTQVEELMNGIDPKELMLEGTKR
ncbi:MAG: hypothetical protein ACP5RF_00470 [Candidatus Micrarchaeia archaeon]